MVYRDNLGSKITVPQVLHKILPRNDIVRAIDEASLDKAVCLLAPYGCGKTLAVISWLRERGAAWLSLDERDNTESVLLADLAAAVLSFLRGQADTEELLADEQYLHDPKAFLLEASSWPAREGYEKIFVLDNLNHIRDVGLQCFIKDFISACLGEWKVVLMSRAELPPMFNDLILKRHICMITLEKLNFSPEEMTDYFYMNGCVVPQQNILQMREDTDGWPAALNVVLTVSRSGPIGYREAARSYVRGFFETEVWHGLDENIRDFLLKTSFLEMLTPSACHAVTEIGASLPILRWLFQNGLFISRLDERDTYRYHRVFQDFLLDKLRASDIDKRLLYKKYAWWLYEGNEVAQSFSYFFKARDLHGVRQTLKILDPAEMGITGFLELVGCITELDMEDLKPYPEIIAKMALVHYLTGDVSTMQSLCHTLLEWNESGMLPISPEEYAEYMWEVGWLCFLSPDELTWDPDDLMCGNKKHLEYSNYRYYVPHLKELQISRLAVHSFPSMFRGMRDYGNDGIFNIESFLKRTEGGEKHLLDEADVLWTTYLIQAEYEYELEHFAKAEEIVRRVMPLVEDRRYTYLYFVCTALLVKQARAVLDPGEIDALTARLETVIMNNGHHFLLPNFHAFELRNRLAGGQAGFTEIFMEENRKYSYKPYFCLLYRHITLARGLLSTGSYSEALIILGNLDLLCNKYNRPTDLIEVNVLRTIALYGLGHAEDACRNLMEALKSAKKYGYIRIFSDDAKDIWPILELVRKQMNEKYIQKIITSCKKALPRAGRKESAPKFPHAELTKTELKILKSLQAGMSYEEIALDNDIRISTVKSHAHSIYSKLEVDNRTSAVMEAKRMGLLE